MKVIPVFGMLGLVATVFVSGWSVVTMLKPLMAIWVVRTGMGHKSLWACVVRTGMGDKFLGVCVVRIDTDEEFCDTGVFTPCTGGVSARCGGLSSAQRCYFGADFSLFSAALPKPSSFAAS